MLCSHLDFKLPVYESKKNLPPNPLNYKGTPIYRAPMFTQYAQINIEKKEISKRKFFLRG
jgi:hypothetical protein